MMTYAFLSLMSLIACMTCSLFIRLGYSDTCRKMIEETQKFRYTTFCLAHGALKLIKEILRWVGRWMRIL